MTTGQNSDRKVCCKCLSEKSLMAFGRLVAAKDGLTYACLDCTRIKMAEWRKNNRDRDRISKNRWASLNKEKIRQKTKKYYAENREKQRLATEKWAKANPNKVNAKFAKRRASKRNATPKWLTPIHQAQIQEMYDVAVACSVQTGMPYHVDHILPLAGRGFNGLHVPWNLRVIPAHENREKTNKLPSSYAHLGWEEPA